MAILDDLEHTETVLATLVLAAVAHSGLYGQVRIDPGTPVCRVGVPCWKPAPDAVLAFARAGKTVAHTTANGKGFYRIALRAGTYTLRIERPRAVSGPKTVRVVVRTGRYRLANVSVDVGIR